MASVLPNTIKSHPHALVVDDSHIARQVLAGLLSRMGFSVDVAESAESAIRKLGGPLPDVVFMDHLLPGIDGLEAVRFLRKQSRTAALPIVMFTSQETEQFAHRARRAGADDIYCKSAEHAQLTDILERLHLISDQPTAVDESGNILNFRREESAAAAQQDTQIRMGDAELASLLEPILHTYHEKLHQELLAEFAILERYQERLRQDVVAQVNSVSRRAAERIDRSFDNRRVEREGERRAARRGRWAIAAAVVLAIGINLGVSWLVEDSNRDLRLQSIAMLASLDAQGDMLADQGQSLGELKSSLAEFKESVAATNYNPTDSGLAERGRIVNPAKRNSSAAGGLVAELQSMGILGPVRIETSAGSFCVISTTDGFQMEASNVAIRDCENLPVRLSVIDW